MTNRLVKIVLVLGCGLYALLVAYNNIDDYGSNYQFVRHVMAMDTTFPNNGGMYRAMTAAGLHQLAYLAIIATELTVAAMLVVASVVMARGLAKADRFARGLDLAKLGLALAFLLWFTGFVAVGGEWFLMWQSATWNGVGTAYDIVTVILLVLGFISLADDGFAARG